MGQRPPFHPLPPAWALRYAEGVHGNVIRYTEEHLDPAPRTERDHLVRLLKTLADRLDQAPLTVMLDDLPWIKAAVEALERLIARAIGRAA